MASRQRKENTFCRIIQTTYKALVCSIMAYVASVPLLSPLPSKGESWAKDLDWDTSQNKD
jgi:hypothetical protein